VSAALTDKTAVVTGAASGIGLATAKALAAGGAHVTLVDVVDELGTQAAHAIGGAYAHLDVSRPGEWNAFLAGFDRLDLLHLNAGIYDIELGDITRITDERYRAYQRVNIDGVFFGLRAAIPLLQASKGAVVVTSSMAGIVPLGTNPLYALTKFALNGFVRSVGADLVTRGIRINAVCPGAVATPIMGDDPHAWYEQHGVVAFEPEDLAETIVDLMTSPRSGEIVVHIPPWPPEVFEFQGLPQH
jgi:NAD(P)-dependent dehydrogenase (short-subunit alcohol dehydrogenase family)